MTTLLDADIDTKIEVLAELASGVINEHINDHGVCAVCGSAFPCDRAVLAEHNLVVCGCLHDGRAGADEPGGLALALSTSQFPLGDNSSFSLRG